jgi:hypothetical protein
MKYHGVFTRHSFTDASGTKQFKWYKAGYLKANENGGQFMRLFHQPQTEFYILEDTQEDKLSASNNQ